MPRSPRLDDLYKMVAHIYSAQNAHRTPSGTLAHLVEVCGMLTIHDRPKKREGLGVEDALCKALAWYFPLMAKLRVRSVEDVVFRKFPLVCPYCRLAPHDDESCKMIRGEHRTVDHDKLRRLYPQNRRKRPSTLNEWQRMFQRIYPRTGEERGRSTLGLLEELGELAEAVRVFESHPKYFVGEAADVFSYIMGLANEHSLRIQRDENREFSFEDEFMKRYPGLCVDCGFSVCVCPPVPEATIGRLAKELDVKDLSSFFGFHPEQMAQQGSRISEEVLDRAGGYAGLAGRFPFDRGQTNTALVVFCLKFADAIQAQNSKAAESLRAISMQVAKQATHAGSRQRPDVLAKVIDSVQSLARKFGKKVQPLVAPADQSLTGKVGRLVSFKPLSILLVLANPPGTPPIRLQEEERAIRDALRLSKARDRVVLTALPAATTDDLRRALLNQDYDIIHFSGHGEPGAVIFEDLETKSVRSSLEALRDLIQRYPSVQCAILNACYSLAETKVPIAPFTVGMDAPVGDRVAIEFARGFYDAIGAGKSYDFAVQEGVTAVKLKLAITKVPIRVLKESTSIRIAA
jgi:NTP pyrophosphatase (non-canonical NTP hydrolase)